jgi:hypothetical protein
LGTLLGQGSGNAVPDVRRRGDGCDLLGQGRQPFFPGLNQVGKGLVSFDTPLGSQYSAIDPRCPSRARVVKAVRVMTSSARASSCERQGDAERFGSVSLFLQYQPQAGYGFFGSRLMGPAVRLLVLSLN